MLASVPGALYATTFHSLTQPAFTIEESIFILAIVIVGGMGNLWRSLAAAAFMILVPEALRFVGLPGGSAAKHTSDDICSSLVFVVYLQCLKPRQMPD